MAGLSEADITERLQSLFAAKVFGKPFDGDDAAALAYEAMHEIAQLREALMMALGPGYSYDPMVQQHIETAKTAMNAMNAENLVFFDELKHRAALNEKE